MSVAKACGKAVVAPVGIQATASSGVGVGEIRAKAHEWRVSLRWWITARELAASRGVRDFCEGNTLKGEA
jgi:hypothetical protein